MSLNEENSVKKINNGSNFRLALNTSFFLFIKFNHHATYLIISLNPVMTLLNSY